MPPAQASPNVACTFAELESTKAQASARALRTVGWFYVLILSTLTCTGVRAGELNVGFNPVQRGIDISQASIYIDAADVQPAGIAAQLLADDIHRVTGKTPTIIHDAAMATVLIGTLGHSGAIDALVAAKKLDIGNLSGQWEAYRLQVVGQTLVIVGSDRRGTAYGVTTLSQRMGVSPWYWWANVPTVHHGAIYVSAEDFTDGPPAVKYRGIFLNDEAPAMSGWAAERFGGFNSKMYVHVFELMLRLRANYLWPAMWGSAFNEDDPQNPKLANDYGIVMGTSHQEPMMRAQAEWDHRHHGSDWNFATDAAGMEAFWREGIKRSKSDDNLITIGMRGRNDTPAIANATIEQSIALLEKIVAVQRKIIADEINPDVTQVPQMWCLYKEVQSYYEHGLRVPDDVTLLWSDDNWGNLRRLPTAAERQRSGGAGIYYHFDYVGEPRNYKWINTNPIAKVWEQMSLADAYGADRIWIVNVGDLKPMEFPISFFMDMAWSPKAMTLDRMERYTQEWATAQFGEAHASKIAGLIAWYTRMNGRRKPELLTEMPYSSQNYHEADEVNTECVAMSAKADALANQLSADQIDAYFQLVQHPVDATAVVNQLYIAAACGDAVDVDRLYKADAALSSRYNHGIAGGFWNHMMDQTHLGYSGWQQPATNVMPKVAKKSVMIATAKSQSIPPPADLDGFAESDGVVAIEAAHYSRKLDTPAAHWQAIDDLGLTGSAVTLFPQTVESVLPVGPTSAAPQLEFRIWLTDAGNATVTTIVSPTQEFVPGRGLRYAIGFDGQPLQVIDTLADHSHAAWARSVIDGVRRCSSAHTLVTPGYHTLKIAMVDPGLVLQKIIIDLGGLRPSALGPPESFRRNAH